LSDNRRALIALGISVDIAENPDYRTQKQLLESTATRDAITERLGEDVDIQLPADWTSPIVFVCSDDQRSACEASIAAFVEKLVEIKKGAILTGLNDVRTILRDLQVRQPTTSRANDIVNLEALAANLNVSMTLIDSSVQSLGSTVTQVRRPTALMGAAAGLLIGLLILLQLTFTDSRVRSARQLVRLTGVQHFLGGASSKPREVADRRVALGLHQQLGLGGRGRVRYLPLRKPLSNTAPMERLAEMVGAQPVVAKPFSDLSVKELADLSPDEVDVLVVQRNRDLRKDVVEAVVALSKSGRRFAGVLLVD